jgi:two-component system sensor histidine kinase ChvG
MTTLPRLARVDAPQERAMAGLDGTGPVAEEATPRARRMPGLVRSPLALRIVLVNLSVVAVLLGAALFLNPFRHSLAEQRQAGLETEARLVAALVAAAGTEGDGAAPAIDRTLGRIAPGLRGSVFVFDAAGGLIVQRAGQPDGPGDAIGTGLLPGLARLLAGGGAEAPVQTAETLARGLAPDAQAGATVTARSRDPGTGGAILAVATPVRPGNGGGEVVVVTGPPGELARLEEREGLRLLLIFGGAILVSVVLSLVLAASITGPLAALASAAEQGRDRHARKMTRGRVRIPDLAERPDEIGRLSKAMRGMVAALYDRIDVNEQFAADVAHEIKNPLASLRAAVGTLRVARRDDQRDRLMDVIEHDVRRLDRLVSDISNASRLDSDLVREESVRFNLLRTLANLGEHLGRQAAETGVEFITDLPPEPILIDGLEGRLAQVFVNLVTNAISFCEEGDAVRLWARRRENRVLIVVEDTGPGIPEAALGKVFDRFYSERPEMDFGNHSGLGLAISKQIVEAHGGVIWAENIRPTHADITSEPLGARFVVGLPV